MDSATLRAIQQPLKDAYRDKPDQALVTLRASGELGEEEVSCSVATGQALAVAGLHPATGGDGSLACSGDMLLQALVACAGVTLRSVATSMKLPVTGGTVEAEGDLDFRGTLAVSKDAPVGFTAIRLRFALETGATSEEIDTLLKLTLRYCVVYQTLAHGTEMTASTDRRSLPAPARITGPRRRAAGRTAPGRRPRPTGPSRPVRRQGVPGCPLRHTMPLRAPQPATTAPSPIRVRKSVGARAIRDSASDQPGPTMIMRSFPLPLARLSRDHVEFAARYDISFT